MAKFSDGSQERKTGDEKELVLVRVERLGIPVYVAVSLLEMTTLVAQLQTPLDSIFETGNVPVDNYQTKLVRATAGEANMNFGIYGGSLTTMVEQRPWLVTIHCINHRLELAIKDASSDGNKSQGCDKFCLAPIFYKKLW